MVVECQCLAMDIRSTDERRDYGTHGDVVFGLEGSELQWLSRFPVKVRQGNNGCFVRFLILLIAGAAVKEWCFLIDRQR